MTFKCYSLYFKNICSLSQAYYLFNYFRHFYCRQFLFLNLTSLNLSRNMVWKSRYLRTFIAFEICVCVCMYVCIYIYIYLSSFSSLWMESKNLTLSLQGFYLRGAVGSVWTTPTEALEIASCLFDFSETCRHWSSQIHRIQIVVSGRWKNIELGYMKLRFLPKYLFMLKNVRIFKIIIWQNSWRYRNRLGKTVVCQTKSLTPMWTFGSRKRQELTAALVQVFI